MRMAHCTTAVLLPARLIMAYEQALAIGCTDLKAEALYVTACNEAGERNQMTADAKSTRS